jgi:hypothetical protein
MIKHGATTPTGSRVPNILRFDNLVTLAKPAVPVTKDGRLELKHGAVKEYRGTTLR